MIPEIITVLGVAVGRSIFGWAENALKDAKIDSFEWAQLGATVVRISVITAGMYFGLNGAGLNIDAIGASAGSVVLDFILGSIKKAGTNKK